MKSLTIVFLVAAVASFVSAVTLGVVLFKGGFTLGLTLVECFLVMNFLLMLGSAFWSEIGFMDNTFLFGLRHDR